MNKSFASKTHVSPMKLQKLVFFAHGYYLAASEIEGVQRPLIDEFFEAWDYGPVNPTLYHEFKEFGGGPINRPAFRHVPGTWSRTPVAPPEGDPLLDTIVEYVWNSYAPRPAMKLSDITHAEGGAWDRARKEAAGLRGKDIPNEYIARDFRPLVKKKAE